MILILLLNTPYLSNIIIWLSSAFNDKVCVMPLRAVFYSMVFPLIFTSPLGTDIIFVCLLFCILELYLNLSLFPTCV